MIRAKRHAVETIKLGFLCIFNLILNFFEQINVIKKHRLMSREKKAIKVGLLLHPMNYAFDPQHHMKG